MFKRFFILVAGVYLLCLLAVPHSVMASGKPASEAVSIPGGASTEQVKDIMAGMSDEDRKSVV